MPKIGGEIATYEFHYQFVEDSDPKQVEAFMRSEDYKPVFDEAWRLVTFIENNYGLDGKFLFKLDEQNHLHLLNKSIWGCDIDILITLPKEK